MNFGTTLSIMNDEEGSDDDLPGRSEEANFAFAVLVRTARRISLLAESSAANLRELNGCEIDRAEMIELFNMVEELADFSKRHLDELCAALNAGTTGATT